MVQEAYQDFITGAWRDGRRGRTSNPVWGSERFVMSTKWTPAIMTKGREPLGVKANRKDTGRSIRMNSYFE